MDKTKSTIRIRLFFDGTGNNAVNAQSRENDLNILSKTGGSYDISPTNIFRLYNNLRCSDDATNTSIYIEGIGTVDGMDDSKTSSATGFDTWNGYDAASKTLKAYNALVGFVKKYTLTTKNSSITLKLDLFGFSRGAALARNFANILHSDESKITQLEAIFTESGNRLEGIEFGFIGLFDTVESMIYPPRVAHLNLRLNSIISDCIFHLTAMHECRENFPLSSGLSIEGSNISRNLDKYGSSCDKQTNVFEMVVPGAHSDIGGGYNKCQDENATINLKATYTAAGAKEAVEEIVRTNPLLAPLLRSIKYEFEALSAGYNAISRRKNVEGHLQLVYAKLMMTTAIPFGVTFDTQQFDRNHPIPEDLLPYFNSLVQSKALLFDDQEFRSLNNEMSSDIVEKYIHISVSTRTLVGKEDAVPTGPLLRSGTVSSGNPIIINRPAKDWKRLVYLAG